LEYNREERDFLIQRLRNIKINGESVKFSEDKIIGIVNKHHENRFIWLELGDSDKGLIHIYMYKYGSRTYSIVSLQCRNQM